MREAADEIEMELAVLPGTESLSRPDMDRPDGRTDIPIFLTEWLSYHKRHDPHAVIECKRVADSRTDLCRAYVAGGIDRFKSGKYGGDHSTGFMIGYIIAGDAQSAVLCINRHLERKSRHDETLKSSDIKGHSWVRKSIHSRESGLSINLYHAFLKFAEAA